VNGYTATSKPWNTVQQQNTIDTPNTWMDLNAEETQSQKVMYCKIPFVEQSQNDKTIEMEGCRNARS